MRHACLTTASCPPLPNTQLVKKGAKQEGSGRRSEFTKSAKVFSQIMQHRDGTAAATAAAATDGPAHKASHLKL